MEDGTACGRCPWGLRWISLWAHDTRTGCTEIECGTACGRCHWVELRVEPRHVCRVHRDWGCMRALLLRPSVELPVGPRNV
eukprot:151040-Pyramimonas_sp.AAC.1